VTASTTADSPKGRKEFETESEGGLIGKSGSISAKGVSGEESNPAGSIERGESSNVEIWREKVCDEREKLSEITCATVGTAGAGSMVGPA
jgi:hypothetical protein